jgi:hypothetical protein
MKQLYLLLIISFFSFVSYSQTPPYTVTVNGAQPDGYYFVAPFPGGNWNHFQMILDSVGNLVYYKKFLGPNTLDFKLQSNGLISYSHLGKYFLLDSTFNKVDSVNCINGIETDHHDMQILSNGHFLLLGEETVNMDLSSYNYFLNNSSPGSPTADVICIVVQELDEQKNIVFEWHAKDYLSFDSVDEFWLNSPTTVDWTHSNAIQMDTDGNILVSSRHLNEITKINRTDSSVMWRFGGKYNQFTFIGDTTPFYGQHNIRRINNGDFTLYDNGNHFTPHGARALEYQLDEINKTAEVKWSYTYDSSMFSYATGNVQRMSDYRTLINYGFISGNRNVHFNVVDSSGNTQFELSFNDTLLGYRSFHFVLPWNLTRPQISCFDSAGTKYLDAGPGYNSYQWNDGSTSQFIAVTSPDTFNVFVPYGQGGFISSERLIVSDMNNPCSTGLENILSASNVNIYPNPVRDVLTLSIGHSPIENGAVDIEISDASGRSLPANFEKEIKGENVIEINVSGLEQGIYFIRVNNTALRFIKIR